MESSCLENGIIPRDNSDEEHKNQYHSQIHFHDDVENEMRQGEKVQEAFPGNIGIF